MRKKNTYTYPRFFIIISTIILVSGLVFFVSGALSLFSQKTASLFWGTVARHISLGLLGLICVWVLLRTNIKKLIELAPIVGIVSILVACLVFIPGLGSSHHGALRWVSIGGFSFQPSESMKIGLVLLSAWYFARYRTKIAEPLYGVVAVMSGLAVVGVIMLLQPDTDSFLVIAVTVSALYYFVGAPMKHIAICVAIAALLCVGLVIERPYIAQRVQTFMNSSNDPLGTSYQVRQSLIAIGSGKLTGRGYGNSVQKYQYLPEPMSDTLFAVVGEELGFLGTVYIVILFLLWYVSCIALSFSAQGYFQRYVIFGLAHVITLQAFINILSNINLIPFSGLPLPFMSQGGTSLFVSILSVGIIVVCARKAQ